MRHPDQIHFSFFNSIAECFEQPVISHTHFKVSQSPNSVWQNILFDPSENQRWSETEIQELTNEIKQNNWPNKIMTNSNTSSKVRMQLNRLTTKRTEWISMSKNLNDTPALRPTKLNVVEVNSEELFQAWLAVVERALMRGKLAEQAFAKWLQMDQVKLLLGFENDVPVCTALGYLEEGEIGLYLISTLEDYSGRGYGTEITQALMLNAKNRGYKTALLYATPMGLPVYKKLGFNSFGIMEVFEFL